MSYEYYILKDAIEACVFSIVIILILTYLYFTS